MNNRFLPKIRQAEYKKGVKNPVIFHGLCADLAKRKIDGRTAVGRALNRLRDGLARIFPEGPDVAASLLIDRIVFKSLNLALYEATVINGVAEVTATGEQKYITMSGSFRADLQLLTTLAKAQTPAPGDPDLKEYLETLKRAAKAQVVKVVEVERG
jgi:hypothetical protein